MSDFKWDGDDADSVILPRQPRTAVYSTQGGGICIRQEKDDYEEYDPQLLLTPQGALAVAWALIDEAHQVGLPCPSASLMVESEHWPPPGRRREEAGVTGGAAPEAGPLLKVMEAAE